MQSGQLTQSAAMLPTLKEHRVKENTFCPSFCPPYAFGLMQLALEATKTHKKLTQAGGQASNLSSFLVSNRGAGLESDSS